eukprot:scaffold942_cov260-Pinguiococcus_pyrenoidosus.AAC.21
MQRGVRGRETGQTVQRPAERLVLLDPLRRQDCAPDRSARKGAGDRAAGLHHQGQRARHGGGQHLL